jgi:hypothetical protein
MSHLITVTTGTLARTHNSQPVSQSVGCNLDPLGDNTVYTPTQHEHIPVITNKVDTRSSIVKQI